MENLIIDFHAAWCAPCKLQKPIVEKFASENDIKVQYIDVEEQPEMAEKYGIRSLPTLIHIKNGQIAETLVGLQKEAVLKAKIIK